MVSTGSIAPNFHQGARSEYLAQYVFSAFGTSIPVPHPEDSGIDLYCTIGERLGQRLLVQNYYFVHVKSEKSEICYNGVESVEWLLAHRYPILICFIDKKADQIEVFQTLALTTCFAKVGMKSITLIPDTDGHFFSDIQAQEDLTLHLGPPILNFNIAEMQHEHWVSEATRILKFWVELDQESIDQKGIGLTIFKVPESYASNQLPEVPKKFIGNFKDILSTKDRERKFYDMFFRVFFQLVNQVVATKDIAKFQIIADFAGQFTSVAPLQESFGIRLLAAAVNTGTKELNHPAMITLKTSDGRQDPPMLTSVK